MKKYAAFVCACISAAFLPLSSDASGNSSAFMDSIGRKVIIVDSYSSAVKWADVMSDNIKDSIQSAYSGLPVIKGRANTDVMSVRKSSIRTIRSIILSASNASAGDCSKEEATKIFDAAVQPICYIFLGTEAWNNFRYMRGVYLKAFGTGVDSFTVPEIVVTDFDSLSNYPFGSSAWESRSISIENSRTIYPEKIRDDDEFKVMDDFLYGSGLATYEPMGVVNSKLPVKENVDLVFTMFPGTKEICFLDTSCPSSYSVWKYLGFYLNGSGNGKIGLKHLSVDRNSMGRVLDTLSVFHPGRVYISYSVPWNENYSVSQQSELDSILNLKGGNPLFYLKEGSFTHNRVIGGYYRDSDDEIGKVVEIAGKYIKGDTSDHFVNLEGGHYMINKSAIRYYRIPARFYSLHEIRYTNCPRTFVSIYRNELLIVLLIMILFVIVLSLYKRYVSNNRKMRNISAKYKSLYDEMSFILGSNYYNVLLYDSSGKLEFSGKNNLDEDYTACLHFDDNKKNNLLKGGTVSTDSVIHGKPYYVVCKRYDKSGGGYGFIEIVSNMELVMEEAEKVEDIEKLVNFAANSVYVGMAFIRLPDEVGFANDLWFQYLGEEKREDDVLKPQYRTLDEEDRKVIMADYQKRRTAFSPPFYREIVITEKSGKQRYAAFYMFSMNDKRMNSDIILQIILDNDKVRNENAELSRAKELAERAEREKDKFLLNVSHEVRTPLNSIVGFSNILASDENISGEDREWMIESIKSNKEQLFKLISDVLDISKFDAKSYKFNYKFVDLNEYFSNYVYIIKQNLRNKNIEVSIGNNFGNSMFVTDGICLNKIYTNLISNACKFTANGSITIGYSQLENYYSFYIKDTGCGISESDMSRLFTRFDKIDEFTPGFGLGLPLAKAVVEGMGGKISILSEKNAGTSVWFTLPLIPLPKESEEL
ncbi:MAG: HAMP domain-containing histidine kinase [Bacteroidales bacterium]|jgi:signal transduction histidine kinase|nr:HAMP domain-containing histidine kinase [Bacteroidales bacterium]MCI2121619.1 HAMP domain-containing histidine kinase [Bacteroidales bacterium]MCI2144702.1 HAMP domain-containing histidine kinase [Bacteroidales bacterium]